MRAIVSVFAALIVSSPAIMAEPPAAASQPAIQPAPFGVHNRWPVYDITQHFAVEQYDMHVIATPGVSPWMIHQSADLIEKMVGALKNEDDRKKFAGHRCFLVTDDDPSIPGSVPGHRNTGGAGFSMFNEDMVCVSAVDTIRPKAKPAYRGWYTPVHEFAHSVELTLGMQKQSDALYQEHVSNYNPEVAREYFCWSVQKWFDSADNRRNRDDLPKWEYDYIASIFDEGNTWTPDHSPRDPKTLMPADQEQADDHAKEPTPITDADLEAMVGRYTQDNPTNHWHRGTITRIEGAPAGEIVLQWTNDAGRSWRLEPDRENARLVTGPGNPYREKPAGKAFLVAFDRSAVGDDRNANPPPAGFWFNGKLFIKQRQPR